MLVVGAGVVGCAVTRRLALEGARIILAEMAGDVLDGARKGNSAMTDQAGDDVEGAVHWRSVWPDTPWTRGSSLKFHPG